MSDEWKEVNSFIVLRMRMEKMVSPKPGDKNQQLIYLILHGHGTTSTDALC